jgi:hypothetical protein
MIKRIFILLMVLVPVTMWAQFAPASCFSGTTAMHADSSAFVAWATGCTVERGLMRINKPNLGYASFGEEALVAGVPGGTYDVVSLGDGGSATVTFASPICNGEGPDFAIFENGLHPDTDSTMTLYFLELAFVEVSSDGEHFFRFPAVTHVQTETQVGGFDAMNPAQIHNFAGKYEAFYGTPFDLAEVEDNALLDKNSVTHIRVIDVVGNINPEYATYDSEGHPVNDPWPTGFNTGGFDLDAIGVIHDLAHGVSSNESETVSVYPNPVRDRLSVKGENIQSVEVFNLVGQKIMTTEETSIDLSDLNEGVYFLRVVSPSGTVTKRIVKQ